MSEVIAAQVANFPEVYQVEFVSDDPTQNANSFNGLLTMPEARDICRRAFAKALLYDNAGQYKGYVHSDGGFFLN